MAVGRGISVGGFWYRRFFDFPYIIGHFPFFIYLIGQTSMCGRLASRQWLINEK
jgi:hypothetical protein